MYRIRFHGRGGQGVKTAGRVLGTAFFHEGFEVQDAPAVFQTLLVHAYRDYYQHPRVVEALGLEPRPPFPKGFEVAPSDLTLLDPVRRRRKMYRDC